MFDCGGRYKIATGTRSLVEAIAADGGFPVRLETAVAAVEQDGGGATVRTRDGEQLEAAAVIVAVAVNTLAAIEFAPELSPAKRARRPRASRRTASRPGSACAASTA